MVSEFMLQQTRIETVASLLWPLPQGFPISPPIGPGPPSRTVPILGGIMGYYARARNLHAAQESIRRDLSGKFPATKEAS